MKVPRTEQNWLSTADNRNLLKLAGFEALDASNRSFAEIFAPAVWFFESSLRTPAISEQALHAISVQQQNQNTHKQYLRYFSIRPLFPGEKLEFDVGHLAQHI